MNSYSATCGFCKFVVYNPDVSLTKRVVKDSILEWNDQRTSVAGPGLERIALDTESEYVSVEWQCPVCNRLNSTHVS